MKQLSLTECKPEAPRLYHFMMLFLKKSEYTGHSIISCSFSSISSIDISFAPFVHMRDLGQLHFVKRLHGVSQIISFLKG